MKNNNINLLDLNIEELSKFCKSFGEKSYHAKQLQQWIYKNNIYDFEKMTNLPKSLRKKLKEHSFIKIPNVINQLISSDGTYKWLIEADKNGAIETVYIPQKLRKTLCISSQIGCPIKCSFCFTGMQGFLRNLTTGEIINQLCIANIMLNKSLDSENRITVKKNNSNDIKITNVVIMGMGEPLLNYNSVINAIRIMLDNNAYSLSRRHIVISTSGIVPMIDKLRIDLPVALAISLHATNDILRDKLVPINKKYPINKLISACHRYSEVAPHNFITFEYCMLNNINDQEIHAYELISLISNIKCKINLIPFNSFGKSIFTCSKISQIKHFANILNNAGIITTIRKTRGNDINASCGQLSGIVKTNIKN